jgi:hypothetical protein
MPDMLVNLLKMPPLEHVMFDMEKARIVVRRAEPLELTQLRLFVEKNFSVAWADEIQVGYWPPGQTIWPVAS